MITINSDEIAAKFKGQSNFGQQELLNLLKGLYPSANVNTLKWKIYDLKQKGIIHPLAKGLYSLTDPGELYLPSVSLEAKQLYEDIRRELPYTELCFAHTTWFNEFMVHQVFRTYLIIEVEKEATLSVFNRLTEWGKKAFLNPTREVFEYYIVNEEDPTIIVPLISESPLMEVDRVKLPTLEKMLVDCISEKEVYNAQYQEATGIFKNAMEKYQVNLSKLRRYARRRNRTREINDLIKKSKRHDR